MAAEPVGASPAEVPSDAQVRDAVTALPIVVFAAESPPDPTPAPLVSPAPVPASPEPTAPGPPTAVDLHGKDPSPGPAFSEADTPPSRASLAPSTGPRRARALSPRTLTWIAIGGGAALMSLLLVPLAASHAPAPKAIPSGAVSFENAQGQAVTFVPPQEDGGLVAEPAASASHSVAWRVASLANDPNVEIVDGTVGKRPIVAALGAAGVAKAEATRVVKAFEKVKKLEHASPKDTFTVAKEKGATGRVVAFEYATSPADVWQARAGEGGALEAKKIDLHVERRRVAVAVAVADDLRASVVRAGLDDDMVKMLGDALEGHADVASIRPGARLRIVATEDRVDGAFGRYVALEAVEYSPPRANAPSTKVYWYQRGGVPPLDASHDGEKKKRAGAGGYYDAKGRQPFQGGWRMPIPLARVSSRFNPHRMHPVLHVVMPHNGVDFGAGTGTPIYATAPGTVRSVGDGGACGNMVQVQHANGLTSAYCHMSRFAPGLHVGQHVEGRQLVGYVGQTGRVTGPHLHFAVKRGETFIDPLSLRLDGVRVLPHADRDEFARRRAELDKALEAIPLPVPSVELRAADAGPEEPAEPEVIYEETPR